ncbi:MAG: L-threonylcarbamoyladenylate synthase [bacterium]
MQEVIKLLNKGKTIVYPTDTAYALGGDFLNKKTRAKIYKIKKRDAAKELSVIANSLSMIKKYCYINKEEEHLAKKYWPGPLSIILRVKPEFQKILGATLMARVPKNKIARDLSRGLNKLLIATSANVSGEKSCYNINDVLMQFSKSDFKPDIIINGGELKNVPASAIVKIVDGKIEVLRQGGIKIN